MSRIISTELAPAAIGPYVQGVDLGSMIITSGQIPVDPKTGLVADDVVELARIAPTTIEGRCPGMLRDYLEVRGLGLLNIRTIFGETAARRKMSSS